MMERFAGAEKGNKAILMLGIVGLTLFELLFEARARYLFIYAPIYIILCIYGLDFLRKKLLSVY